MVLPFLIYAVTTSLMTSIGEAGDTLPFEPEFSGSLLKRVNGNTYQAQVFGKGDRLRLEYKYAVRTELGFSALEIIRLDLGERWYVLPQQKYLLVLPVMDGALLIRKELVGETSRNEVGDAIVAGRAARQFDVQVERDGVSERFHQWVDIEVGVVLKLVSQDQNWSFEYERIRVSPQPYLYFEQPPGYRKRRSETIH